MGKDKGSKTFMVIITATAVADSSYATGRRTQAEENVKLCAFAKTFNFVEITEYFTV